MKTTKTKYGSLLNAVIICGNVFIAGLIFSACNNTQPNGAVSNTTTAGDTTVATVDSTSNIQADWQKFKQDANQQIADANDSIATFKKRAKKLNGKMKAKYEHEVVILQQQNDELKAKLDSFKIDTKYKWDDFKMSFNADMAKLKDYLRDSTNAGQK
jgi:hypothetical protein